MEKLSYPKTILEFVSQFHSDEVCLDYLISSRWPEGFQCPKCKGSKGWWLRKFAVYECASCTQQTSPMSGTLMHGSHISIRYWFWAAYLVSTGTPGISAVQLQRQLGLKNYRTVWFMLHRLREGMVKDGRVPLSGIVEADETYIGGLAKGYKGRGVKNAPNKTLIAGAVEVISFFDKKGEPQEKAGRIRLQILQSASGNDIKIFLNTNVSLGSTIKTDGWKSYCNEALAGYTHLQTVQTHPEHTGKFAPHIHQAFGNLQSWLIGTHHGVSGKYLQPYLDEFVFRFNRREHPMAGFRSLLSIVSAKEPLKLSQLLKPDSTT